MAERAKWRKPTSKWRWRDFLTDDEREIVKQADEAKNKWLALNNQKAGIANRAIHRAKYHAARPSPAPTEK